MLPHRIEQKVPPATIFCLRCRVNKLTRRLTHVLISPVPKLDSSAGIECTNSKQASRVFQPVYHTFHQGKRKKMRPVCLPRLHTATDYKRMKREKQKRRIDNFVCLSQPCCHRASPNISINCNLSSVSCYPASLLFHQLNLNSCCFFLVSQPSRH